MQRSSKLDVLICALDKETQDMGVLRSLGSRTSSGGQEDQTSIQSIEDLRNLLDETLHFFAESRGKLYKTLSKMKDEVLFSKVP